MMFEGDNSAGIEWYKNIKPGEKVIVFPVDYWKDSDVVTNRIRRIHGIGEYLGEFIPPQVVDTGGEGIIITFDEEGRAIDIETDGIKEPAEEHSLTEPKIELLPDGKIIWGSECCWRPLVLEGVNALVEMIGRGFSVRIVDIDEQRAKWAGFDTPGANN